MSVAFRVLATGYYDGATEGFFSEQSTRTKARFFQVIAWDNDQDQRLFAVVDIDGGELSRLEMLLNTAGERPSKPVWVPKWKFRDAADTAEANGILVRCKERLKKDCQLAVGEDISSATFIVRLTEQVRNDVADAIDRDTPDDLGAWRSRLPS